MTLVRVFFLLSYSYLLHSNASADLLDPYNDEILYNIDWLEDTFPDTPTGETTDEDITTPDSSIVIHTDSNESYRCVVPLSTDSILERGDKDSEDISSADVLLDSIFLSKECVYLVEGYWSYELCHGVHLRQFHEERDNSGKVKVTEYILGKQTSDQFPPEPILPPPVWQYNGIDYPYYEVEFDSGTLCDIREGVGRSVRLIYICIKDHSIIPTMVMVKESKTCEYEAVIITNQLCHNPAYRLKEKPVYSIKCSPVDDSPRIPKAFELYDFPSPEPPKTTEDAYTDPHRSVRPQTPPTSPLMDEKFVKSFLNSDYCLLGRSTGWWQHELCFGRHVKQVHMENGVAVQEVLLGQWSETEHREWYAKAGKSKKSKNHVMHLYSNGEICDLTSSTRRVRVKFRCTPNVDTTAKVAVYLEEPTSCNYILTVEAKFICHLLETVDEHGLFQ